ncbi:hypothetical protein CC79DRAFT_1397689 [Sarocladium strictum]|jgi:hypothetical protein
MIFALIFVLTRIGQIITLIPIMGMLAWFVDRFTKVNALTPASILVLFIVSVLALAWAIFTLFSYHRSSANARFIAFVDLCFVGALIAGVYYLRGIADADCTNISFGDRWTAGIGEVTISGPGINWTASKPCVMLKAAWALAIINIIWFFVTAVFAFWHGGRLGAGNDRYVTRSSSHHRRHSHRRSHSGSRYSSHRSPHSHRRVYV